MIASHSVDFQLHVEAHKRHGFTRVYSSPPSRPAQLDCRVRAFEETQGALMCIGCSAADHLHGSRAFVNGSARCIADLMYCNITSGLLNTSYNALRFILCTFFKCSSFGL